MKKTMSVGLKKGTEVSEVLKNNLFELKGDEWVYTDDNGQLAMSITYSVNDGETVLDVWMINEDMQVLMDKIADEI